jgi:YidC/Oxa1 family membrane protein insertase
MGLWDAFVDLIRDILAGIYGFCGDWGLSIIILTFIVRLLIMPLMTRSTRSSAKMQVLQPKMQELQERYANDPETLQKEMSKFYAENKFNPLDGCLPVILQMPIFFALFTAIRDVGRLSSGTASFFNIIPDLTVGPAQVIAASGIPAAAVYIFLDLLFGGLTLVPLLLNTQASADPQQQRTSRIMGIVMAVWMVWIGWSLPSGVLLYYNTSALWQVAQQQLITKRVMDEAKAKAEAEMENRPVEIDVVRKDRKKRPRKKA